MITNICTTVFFCTLVICITIYHVQKLKKKNEEELFKLKSKLQSDLEFEKKMKEIYKNLSIEMGTDKIRTEVGEIYHLLNDYVIKKEKKEK